MIRLQMLAYSLGTPEIEALARLAAQAAVDVLRTSDCDVALNDLDTRRFDGLVLDSALIGAKRVLDTAIASKSNSKVATLSVADNAIEGHKDVSRSTRFVLWKGSTSIAIANTFRALYVVMLAGRQRYFRCPVEMMVRFTKEDATDDQCFAKGLNLSHGGILITAMGLQEGDTVTLEFDLPGRGPGIEAVGEVLRAVDNRAAVQFVSLSPENRAVLKDWLSSQCMIALERSNTAKKQIAAPSLARPVASAKPTISASISKRAH